MAQPPPHATSPRQLRYLLPLAQFDVGRAQAYRRGGARAKRSTGSDLTEEQKQEIREAFDLFGTASGSAPQEAWRICRRGLLSELSDFSDSQSFSFRFSERLLGREAGLNA